MYGGAVISEVGGVSERERKWKALSRGGNSSWLVVAVELSSGHRCGDRGIEEGTALCDFGIALRQ